MSAARNLDAEFLMEEQTIRLEERVASIQVNVTEIKADYRRLDSKVDATQASVSDVKGSVSALRVETKDGFASCDRRMAEFNASLIVLNGRLDGVTSEGRAARDDVKSTRTDLSDRITVVSDRLDQKTAELSARIDRTTTDLSNKIDQRTVELSSRIDQTAAELSNKIDRSASEILSRVAESRASIMQAVNALWDRKFFRAAGSFISAALLIAPATAFAVKNTLGLAELTLLAAGASVAILTGTYFATRTKI
jgi:chromosome segregation ATPase